MPKSEPELVDGVEVVRVRTAEFDASVSKGFAEGAGLEVLKGEPALKNGRLRPVAFKGERRVESSPATSAKTAAKASATKKAASSATTTPEEASK